MQLNKNMLDQLLSLDDATLAKTIYLLADAAGIDKKAAEAAVSDLRLVRASLSNAGSGDLSKAVALLGEERAKALSAMLGRH